MNLVAQENLNSTRQLLELGCVCTVSRRPPWSFFWSFCLVEWETLALSKPEDLVSIIALSISVWGFFFILCEELLFRLSMSFFKLLYAFFVIADKSSTVLCYFELEKIELRTRDNGRKNFHTRLPFWDRGTVCSVKTWTSLTPPGVETILVEVQNLFNVSSVWSLLIFFTIRDETGCDETDSFLLPFAAKVLIRFLFGPTLQAAILLSFGYFRSNDASENFLEHAGFAGKFQTIFHFRESTRLASQVETNA